MKAIIVANGVPADPAGDRRHIRSGGLVVAADGGADYCRKLGVTPDIIIGDMDSISRDPAGRQSIKNAEIIRHPARKDATDLELAVHLAVERGARDLLILGALGGRWDMSLGNLLLPALPQLKKISVRLIDGRQEITLLTGKNQAVFQGRCGDTLSLLPIGSAARGITLQGLEYKLEKETLHLGSSRGISNVLTGNSACVALESGSLICVLIRQLETF